MEVLKERSINERHVNSITVARCTWMTQLIEYLQHSNLPDSHEEARKVRVKVTSYVLVDRELYRKGFTTH